MSQVTQKRLASAVQAEKAMALKIAGASYSQIGNQLGISSERAYAIIKKCFDELHKKNFETAKQMHSLELQRLDALQTRHWPKAMKGDEKATNTVLNIMKHRATLCGFESLNEAQQDNSMRDDPLARINFVLRGQGRKAHIATETEIDDDE